MTSKDKKDPYKEVAESLELGEGDGNLGFDSTSLNKDAVDSGSSAEADESVEKKVSELTELIDQERENKRSAIDLTTEPQTAPPTKRQRTEISGSGSFSE